MVWLWLRVRPRGVTRTAREAEARCKVQGWGAREVRVRVVARGGCAWRLDMHSAAPTFRGPLPLALPFPTACRLPALSTQRLYFGGNLAVHGLGSNPASFSSDPVPLFEWPCRVFFRLFRLRVIAHLVVSPVLPDPSRALSVVFWSAALSSLCSLLSACGLAIDLGRRSTHVRPAVFSSWRCSTHRSPYLLPRPNERTLWRWQCRWRRCRKRW
jgi:hypothetical protein